MGSFLIIATACAIFSTSKEKKAKDEELVFGLFDRFEIGIFVGVLFFFF